MNSRQTTLYIGVAGDLNGRIFEHKNKLTKGFTSRYNIDELVYYEDFDDPNEAIGREKELKDWLRKKKIDLVKSVNPRLKDLAEDWYEGPRDPSPPLGGEG